MAASVIAAGQDYTDTVTLDVGRKDGVRAHETVLNGQGLVGTVTQVSADTSTVLLADDASAVVGARLAGSNQIGSVAGTGKSLSGPTTLKLTLFAANAVLQSGQYLVTFGSVHDTPYVPGVPIGQVTKVEGNAGSLTKTALVKPYVDFTSLGVVGVVVGGPAKDPRDSVLPAAAKPVPTVTVTVTPSAGTGTGREPEPAEPARARAPVPGAEVRRLILSVVLVAVALAAQLTIVNRLSLPGGGGPDLVLLVVVALALTGGPLAGTLIGFLAGLALDVAPPAGHTVGEYALVFCIVGYVCGRLASLGDESPSLYVAISAGAAAVGAVLYAVLGVMLSDPQVTWSSVQHVLPSAVVYNVLLSPFVLFGVVKLYRWAGGAGQEGPSAAMSSAAAGALGAAGLATGAVRQASASGSPRLHLGDRRGSSDAWIGSARASGPPRAGGTGLGGTRAQQQRGGWA